MNKKRRSRIILIKGIDPQASKVNKIKYAVKELRKRWKDKDTLWWKSETSRYILQFYYGIIRGNGGIYVLDEDWDNLIILDACRYDVLREVMGEDIDYRVSRGSNTLEWIRENFTDGKHYDIVYVNANPWVNRLAADSFHKIISVWKDGWDDNLNTVHPKTMTEYAKKAAKEYPDKRLIIHYMQPHQPFIGKHSFRGMRVFSRNLEPILSAKELKKILKGGNIDPQVVRDAYKESLKATLPYIFELLGELKGRTVISADHGELFGKKMLFFTFKGHHWGIHVPELIKVPWVVFEGEERKQIEEGGEKERLKGKIRALKELGKV